MWMSLSIAWWMLLTEPVTAFAGERYESVQPIVLTATPGCCSSPADTASEPVCLPADGTYVSIGRTQVPTVIGDPCHIVPPASCLTPLPRTSLRLTNLPATPTRRGYDMQVTTMADYPPPYTVMSPLEPASLLPPVVMAPSAPTVPEGYVVGRGLIGQPKLYKPGQPVRNFLRYMSL